LDAILENTSSNSLSVSVSIERLLATGEWEEFAADIFAEEPYPRQVRVLRLEKAQSRRIQWRPPHRLTGDPLVDGTYRVIAFVTGGQDNSGEKHVLAEFRVAENTCRTGARNDRPDVGSGGAVKCEAGLFEKAASEGLIVEVARPFVVRTLEGSIESEGGPWPHDVSVEVDLRGSDGGRPKAITKTDLEGHFKIADVPAGSYCFKASAPGWQSTVGQIVVEPKADPEARVSFRMALGV
jgi:hypothetical protein